MLAALLQLFWIRRYEKMFSVGSARGTWDRLGGRQSLRPIVIRVRDRNTMLKWLLISAKFQPFVGALETEIAYCGIVET